jgi:lipoate-protein ligase A
MSSKIRLFKSNSLNVFENLAIENHLLMNIEDSIDILLWSCHDAVVMGRFQNPWLETNLSYLKENKITLARRQSGGGTVYCDLENLNFCIIHPQRDFQKSFNHQLIIETLKSFGIESTSSQRTDLLIEHHERQFKISGSAFKQKKDRSFHHGTLLIDANKERLSCSLKTNHEILESKSIASNPQPVINLSEVNPAITKESFSEALERTLSFKFNSFETLSIDFDQSMQEYYKMISDWQWVVGETPYFKIQKEGHVYEIKKGINLETNEKVNLETF